MEEKTIITRRFKCAQPLAITLSSDGLICIVVMSLASTTN